MDSAPPKAINRIINLGLSTMKRNVNTMDLTINDNKKNPCDPSHDTTLGSSSLIYAVSFLLILIEIYVYRGLMVYESISIRVGHTERGKKTT